MYYWITSQSWTLSATKIALPRVLHSQNILLRFFDHHRIRSTVVVGAKTLFLLLISTVNVLLASRLPSLFLLSLLNPV